MSNLVHGFINTTGDLVFTTTYPSVEEHFSDGLCPVQTDLGISTRFHYVDRDGKIIIKSSESDSYALVVARPFSEGLAAVAFAYRDGRGYINKQGELIIEPDPCILGFSFKEGLTPVSVDEKLGYMDSNGKLAISPQFDWMNPRDASCPRNDQYFRELLFMFSCGFAVVLEGVIDRCNYINQSGQLLLAKDSPISAHGRFSEDLAAVLLKNKYGYIDRSGDLVIGFNLDAAEPFSEGLAQVKVGSKWGYIDTKGCLVIEPQFDNCSPFTEGLAYVDNDCSSGYIDKTGAINIQRHAMRPFRNGLAAYGESDNYGYIDRSGNYSIEPKFARAGDFFDERAHVSFYKDSN